MTGLVVHRLVAFVCRAARAPLTTERDALSMTSLCDEFDSLVREARKATADLTAADRADPASIREEFAGRVEATNPGLRFEITAVKPGRPTEGPQRLNVWELGLAIVLGIVLGFVMLHPGCGAR